MEVNSIVDWRKFYFERYIFAGKIVGRYYDDEGNPTKYLKGIEMKAKRGAQLLEKQKSEEAKIPNCNSKWSQQEGGEVSTLISIFNCCCFQFDFLLEHLMKKLIMKLNLALPIVRFTHEN
jgi:hypothetical protein